MIHNLQNEKYNFNSRDVHPIRCIFLCKNVGVESNGVFNGVLRNGKSSPHTRDLRTVMVLGPETFRISAPES